MEFYGMRFEYDGVSSRLYDLMIASVSKSRDMSVSGKATVVTMHNRRPTANYYLNTRWDKGNLVFDMEFVSERALTEAEQRAITKWLFRTDGYKRMYFELLDDEQAEWFDIVDGETVRTYLNCILTEPEKIDGFGGVCGYKCKAVCDAPNAWSDEIAAEAEPDLSSYSVNTDGEEYTFNIYVNSDMGEYIYPELIVTTSGTMADGSSPAFRVWNETDSSTRITGMDGLGQGVTVTMDGQTNYISDGLYEKFTLPYFLRLMDGMNELHVKGSVSKIGVIWRNRRYL